MNTNNLEQLQQFIDGNSISRVNGIMIFGGIIRFDKYDNEYLIKSDVQVIVLPGSSVLYIVEFFKDEYAQNEMYSTADYQFTCTNHKTLRISNDAASFTMEISLA